MTIRVLALDVSTKTGWASFLDGKYEKSGSLPQVKVSDFNVNKDPQLAPQYPFNIVRGAEEVANRIVALWSEFDRIDLVVIENTNKGKNRHTQRLLEWIHLTLLRNLPTPAVYMDTSQWRSAVQLWMTKDDRKNNRDVSAGKKRGRINKKHLAVRMVNEIYGLKLKLKDNDEADAILMGRAYSIRHAQPQEPAAA